ncbi:MAG: N-6 DNA methylase [Verrucomicrobiae bacterium]|nr:N-6 DNA methylase [Verrucomicrobiae bacterium]
MSDAQSLEEHALQTLHWINLLSGAHFSSHPHAFKPEGRLDSTLTQNLLHARDHLKGPLDLKEECCHDLLARLIFIQFLFHRKDSQGNPALHAGRLRTLAQEGVLKHVHTDLPGLLEDYDDSYRFFEWLNAHFNGDLFPGKGATATVRRQEWLDEKRQVRPEHLSYLARFISGREDLRHGQAFFWPQYAFDSIPLDLISSIYELFIGPAERDKAYYTRGHLVDFMLDAMLPWEGKKSDLRILDPSCGSGIFLVKAFQRLVHRWKQAHNSDPKPSELRDILERQIFGVDINPDAVRVASFSLYLALCDELDPRRYWSHEKLFPALRGKNLIAKDFLLRIRLRSEAKKTRNPLTLSLVMHRGAKAQQATSEATRKIGPSSMDGMLLAKTLGLFFSLRQRAW